VRSARRGGAGARRSVVAEAALHEVSFSNGWGRVRVRVDEHMGWSIGLHA
jgi:hypothetical protein